MRYKTIKKITTIIAIISMLTSTACAAKTAENGGDSVGHAENADQTLTLITWNQDSTLEALDKINQSFYDETGIKVDVVSVEAKDYEEFLREKIEDKDVDIFCYTTDSRTFTQAVVDWAPSEMLSWEKIITDGRALDISGYDFIENWSSGAEACRYKDGIYGISTGLTIMNGLFYNKKLFEVNGWNEPNTWDEFVDLCEKIKAKNIAPITVGGADTWPVQMISNAVVDSVEEGECEALTEGLWIGERKFTDDKSMTTFNRELQILSYFEDDFLDTPYSEAPHHLVEGKAAMLYDGSWNAFEIKKADPNFEYGYFAIPGDNEHYFTCKYDLTLGINAKSKQSELAVKWLEYFSNPDVYKVYVDTNGFVPTMSWIDTSNEFLAKIDDSIKDAERTYECYNRTPNGIGNQGSFDIINYSVAGGEYDTPEEFANAAQEEWDRALAQ